MCIKCSDTVHAAQCVSNAVIPYMQHNYSAAITVEPVKVMSALKIT